jgi:hypothetical protein
MFSLQINVNERHKRTQEMNYVSVCITLLDSRPRTEFGLSGPQSLDSSRLETCSRLRVKLTLSVAGYESNYHELHYQRKRNVSDVVFLCQFSCRSPSFSFSSFITPTLIYKSSM